MFVVNRKTILYTVQSMCNEEQPTLTSLAMTVALHATLAASACEQLPHAQNKLK